MWSSATPTPPNVATRWSPRPTGQIAVAVPVLQCIPACSPSPAARRSFASQQKASNGSPRTVRAGAVPHGLAVALQRHRHRGQVRFVERAAGADDLRPVRAVVGDHRPHVLTHPVGEVAGDDLDRRRPPSRRRPPPRRASTPWRAVQIAAERTRTRTPPPSAGSRPRQRRRAPVQQAAIDPRHYGPSRPSSSWIATFVAPSTARHVPAEPLVEAVGDGVRVRQVARADVGRQLGVVVDVASRLLEQGGCAIDRCGAERHSETVGQQLAGPGLTLSRHGSRGHVPARLGARRTAGAVRRGGRDRRVPRGPPERPRPARRRGRQPPAPDRRPGRRAGHGADGAQGRDRRDREARVRRRARPACPRSATRSRGCGARGRSTCSATSSTVPAVVSFGSRHVSPESRAASAGRRRRRDLARRVGGDEATRRTSSPRRASGREREPCCPRRAGSRPGSGPTARSSPPRTSTTAWRAPS